MIVVLIICIISSSFLNLGFSEAKKRQLDGAAVIWVNYVCVVLVSLLILAWFGWPRGSFDLRRLADLPINWDRDAVYTYCILWGLINGIFYYLCFDVNQRAIVRSGPSLATLASKLGVIVLSGVTARLWGEAITPALLAGMILACAAFCLLLEGKKSFSGMVPVVFLVGGLTEIVKKIYVLHSDNGDNILFNLLAFLVSLILSSVVLYQKRHSFRVARGEAVIGCLVGAANLIASYLIILVLTAFPASVVFPTVSGGAIMLTALFGALLYGEALSLRRWAGIVLTIASLILMNLSQ